MKKTILLTIPNFRSAGSQHVLLSLYRQYKANQYQVYILIEDPSGIFPEEVVPGDRITIIKQGYLNLLTGIKYVRQLITLIKEKKINVLHSWDYRGEIWEGLACRISGCYYLYTKKNNAWSKKWFIKSILANFIAYDQPLMRDRFFKTYFLQQKSKLIPHGIDTSIFKPSSPKNEISYVIACIGNINVNKNQQLFLDALPQCEIDLQCFLYGSGNEKYINELKNQIQNRKLQNKIIFKGIVKNINLPSILNQIDILILPSFNEGLPVVLLEALACGTYCLASNSGGGSRYIIESCKYGALFEPHDAKQLAKLITDFYKNPLRHEGSIEAVAMMREKFTVENEAREYLYIIENS